MLENTNDVCSRALDHSIDGLALGPCSLGDGRRADVWDQTAASEECADGLVFACVGDGGGHEVLDALELGSPEERTMPW